MNTFDKKLIEAIINDSPKTLGEAIELARSRCSYIDDKVVVASVLRLESQGKILLQKPRSAVSDSLLRYFTTGHSTLFWIVLGLSITNTIMILAVSEDAYPLVYLRYVFGLLFALFLPGHCLVRALFRKGELDNIEIIALSVGLSLALVPLAGLLLNFTPLGIRTVPLTFFLLGATLIFSLAASVRDYCAHANPE